MIAGSDVWRLENVCLAGRPAPRLRNVSVTIPAGVVAVVGPSGAGKSSLLSILVGFERPDSGRVVVLQSPAKGQAAVFWGPSDDGLWGHLTVRQHLTTVAPSTTCAERIDSLLAALDLGDLAAARPDRLSLGERSRLNVARALAVDAAVLVLDEPLAHVEAGRQPRFWAVIRDELRRAGTQLIFATHDREAVLREARHVLCLEGGELTFTGSVEDLYRRPASRSLAELLGPVNWLTPAERQNWLPAAGEDCVRPEVLVVEPADSGSCELLSTETVGPRSTSRFQNGSQQIQLEHRVPLEPLRAGQRVRLRALPWLLMLVGLWTVGCGGGEEPALSIREVESWNLPANEGRMPAPRGICPGPDHEVFVLDNAGRVLVYDADHAIKRQWWMPEYAIGKAEGVCVLRDGRVAVADTHYHQVVIFDQTGQVLLQFGKYGEGPGEFIYPVKVIQAPSGTLYVCEYGGHDRVQMFQPDGTWLGEFGTSGTAPGEFQRPSGIVWREGLLYVADAFNNRVQVFTEQGKFVRVLADGVAGASLYYPYDLTLTPDDRLCVVEYGGNRVTEIDLEGRLIGRYGVAGGGERQLMTPWGITVDDQGRVLVCDTGNRRLVRLTR